MRMLARDHTQLYLKWVPLKTPGSHHPECNKGSALSDLANSIGRET